MSTTLAEYLDSTPERRARRDQMLAMCDEIDENRRHPYRRMAGPDGIVRINERQNSLTGEWLSVRPLVHIHHDDVDWLLAIWAEGDWLDYEIWRAGAQCGTG